MKRTALFFVLAYIAIQSISDSDACPDMDSSKAINAMIDAIKASELSSDDPKTWTFSLEGSKWEISDEGYEMVAKNKWDDQLPNTEIYRIDNNGRKIENQDGKTFRICKYKAYWKKVHTKMMGSVKFKIQSELK